MALVVETGAIIAGAESYVDVAAADTYHLNNGNAAWATSTTQLKEAALRKACRFLDGKYRLRLKGRRVMPVIQPLEWPRGGVSVIGINDRNSALYDVGFAGQIFIPSNIIPQRLKDAQCELALRALSGDLATDATAGVKREKVDVLETEYFPGAVPGQMSYQVVDQLLSDYLIPFGSADLLRG